MSIKVSQVSKFYNDQKALDEVSFTVNKGEVTGFLGPNGAGKSTMMKILTTYLKASSGTTSVNNFSTQEEALAVRRSVGYLAENNPLYPEMYIREYLKLHADLNKAPKERIETVIELTGLHPRFLRE